MFSRCIWGIFNIQIQRDRGHKLMLFMFQNKDKDLLGIYQYGCDPFCVSLLTDRHLKVRSNSILFTFSDKGALTSYESCVARKKKLAHDIVRYVSKFQRSDRHNYFFIGKKPPRKHFAKNNTLLLG